jgi:hypothetical protein
MPEIDKNKVPHTTSEMAQRFVQFVMLQVQNIYYVLGRIPSQDGRPMPPNLEAAKMLIDQLEMIQEKTRGNLVTQEGAILDDALKNARLAFVETSGGTPASMMPPTPGLGGGFPLEEEEELLPPAAEEKLSAITPPSESPAASPAAAPLAKPAEESRKKFSKTYG